MAVKIDFIKSLMYVFKKVSCNRATRLLKFYPKKGPTIWSGDDSARMDISPQSLLYAAFVLRENFG